MDKYVNHAKITQMNAYDLKILSTDNVFKNVLVCWGFLRSWIKLSYSTVRTYQDFVFLCADYQDELNGTCGSDSKRLFSKILENGKLILQHDKLGTYHIPDLFLEDLKIEKMKTEELKTEELKTEDMKIEDMKIEDMKIENEEIHIEELPPPYESVFKFSKTHENV